MKDSYEDIIDLPHPTSKKHERMSRMNRAAQFAPFSALTGLGRALKKDKHLQASIGEEVELRTYTPIEGEKEFAGILLEFDKDNITIETDGERKVFARKNIALIRLALDF